MDHWRLTVLLRGLFRPGAAIAVFYEFGLIADVSNARDDGAHETSNGDDHRVHFRRRGVDFGRPRNLYVWIRRCHQRLRPGRWVCGDGALSRDSRACFRIDLVGPGTRYRAGTRACVPGYCRRRIRRDDHSVRMTRRACRQDASKCAALRAAAPTYRCNAAGDLRLPTHLVKDSPESSRGVATLLTRALPRVEVVEFEGLGHMGPVTHPEVVNEAISDFLDRFYL